jgi:hypothetical protein
VVTPRVNAHKTFLVLISMDTRFGFWSKGYDFLILG